MGNYRMGSQRHHDFIAQRVLALYGLFLCISCVWRLSGRSKPKPFLGKKKRRDLGFDRLFDTNGGQFYVV
jgi:hypothetical protein